MKKIVKKLEGEIKGYLKEFNIGNKKLLNSHELDYSKLGDSFPIRNNYSSYDFLKKLKPIDRDKKILANTLLVYFKFIEKINIKTKDNFIFHLEFHYNFEEEYRDDLLFPYYSYYFLKNNTKDYTLYRIKTTDFKTNYEKYIYELLSELGLEKYFTSKCFIDNDIGEYLILLDLKKNIGGKISLNNLKIKCVIEKED